MVQKQISMTAFRPFPSSVSRFPNTRDRVISDNGNEYPKKNVFSVSFSICTQRVYSLLMITREAIPMPMDRHHREAW